MNRIPATMDDLPELPFEKVLSYLSLEDRIKARAVSRRWYTMINCFKVKTLCYSYRPSGFVERKSRWVSGAFAQNFISSTRFASFFNTFGPTILSNLKRLRLCNLKLKDENLPAFTEILQSFGQLEELDIIRFGFPHSVYLREFELNLPMLKSVHIEDSEEIGQLTLDAPRLQKVRMDEYYSQLDLVHVESVERVTIDRFDQMAVKQLKNLKQLYFRSFSDSMDPTLLSGLEQLNEVHLNGRTDAAEMLEQKRRYGRTDLKVYLYGLLLNGPEDPEMSDDFNPDGEGMFAHWAENQSRLADEIPFYRTLDYSTIERVAPEVAINVLERLTDLDTVYENDPIQDTGRFLDFLKNFDKITELRLWCVQPQELFDRLPEHCAVQCLFSNPLPPDHQFLFRLRHLNFLYTDSLDVESVRRILERLEFVRFIQFFANKWIKINIDKQKRFRVSVEGSSSGYVPDVNAVIEFIMEKTQSRLNSEQVLEICVV